MSDQDEMAQAFGEFIRAQRRLAKLSQRQLGRMSGVSDSYLSQMERGLYRPSPEIMKSLARVFGLPPSVLYAQFGLMDDEEVAEASQSQPGVEDAIRRDSQLGVDEKDALLLMYRSLTKER